MTSMPGHASGVAPALLTAKPKHANDTAADPVAVPIQINLRESAHTPSPKDRTAAGKALRDKVTRALQGRWKRPDERVDPTEILHAGDANRMPELVPIRYGRMLQSPFAFFRGSTAVMAADLARMPGTGLHVHACGDCHLMNFGGFATPERRVIFDINDFDETSPAPWEWDIKRLAVSFVLAARDIGLSDRKGRDAAEACVHSYRRNLRRFATMHPLELWYAQITDDDILAMLSPSIRSAVIARIAKATARSGSEVDFPKLAGMVGGRMNIRDAPPLIFHPVAARAPEFEVILAQVFQAYRETLSEDRRVLLDRYRVVDAAIKVVGVGSVGRRCWIALLMSESNQPLFLQFKEAVESALELHVGRSPYASHGERVVMGQRLMQPVSDIFLGWVVAPNGKHFYVRQLRDAKIKPMVETFDDEMLELYAKACGWALARAHAKASDVSAIAGYLGSSSTFDEALGDFAIAYADQSERDHAALKAAVRKGKVTAFTDS